MAEKMMILMNTFQSAQTIRKMVDWQSIGLEVVAVEYNGAIGLEQFDYFKPRIVILDSMVSVIGTDNFVEEMMSSSSDFHIVLLDDLDEKLSNILHIYRVLKKSTVTAAELRSTVLEIVDTLNRDNRQIDSAEFDGRFLRLSQAMGNGDFSISTIQTMRNELGLTLHQNVNIVLPYPSKAVDGMYSDALLSKIRGALAAYCGGEPIVMHDGVLCIIVNSIQQPAKKETSYENLLFDLRKILTSAYQFHWTFIIGNIVPLRDLSREYAACRSIYNHGYFCKELNQLRKGYLQKRALSDEQEPIHIVSRIVHNLMQPDVKLIRLELEQLFSNQKKNMNLERVCFWKRTLELVFLSMVLIFEIDQSSLRTADFFDHSYCTIEDDEEGLTRLFTELHQAIMAQDKKAINPLTIQAVIHIISNYSNDITLRAISTCINVAPTYLSHLFKKDVGITFIDYFTMIRITCAKRILLQTDQRIVDIATEVGFSDYRYFSRVFRKYVGKTPSEFKVLSNPN